MGTETDPLMARAQALKLHGLLGALARGRRRDVGGAADPVGGGAAHHPLVWSVASAHAHLGRFKSLADFDWDWPKRCDREAVEELMRLAFLKEAGNVVLIGPNGVGKSTIARNIAHQAVLAGQTVLCTSAGHMLNELAGADGDNALRHRLSVYARPRLLLIDEIGYLSYSNRHADLLFEIVSRRYQEKSTLVTTNRPFSEWGEVFPNAACVVSLVDRLVHHAEIIQIEGESYRLKEAKERSEQRRQQRAAHRAKPQST